jgi:hypothetical protein
VAVSQEDKKFYIDQAIKVGLVIGAVYAINKALTFGQPGRVDRVKFNLEKTQNRYMPTGNPPPNDFSVIPDPWTPGDLSRRLHTGMNDIQLSDDARIGLFREVQALGLDRARYLHNYWLNTIDPKETVYRWIDGEMVAPKFLADKEKAKYLLEQWGVGF